MTKTEIYNSDYTKLNHAYIQIFETYQKLAEAQDVDIEVASTLGEILMVFNPILDKIKSEMTVKTRYKDGSVSSASQEQKTEVYKEKCENGGIIFHPKFN